jgi:hypothetical protein
MTLVDLKAQAYDAISMSEFLQSRLAELNRAISGTHEGDDSEQLKMLKAQAYDTLVQLQSNQSRLVEINAMIRNWTDQSDPGVDSQGG